MVPRKECRTLYFNKCEKSPFQKCQTKYRNKCGYEKQCTTSYKKHCTKPKVSDAIYQYLPDLIMSTLRQKLSTLLNQYTYHLSVIFEEMLMGRGCALTVSSCPTCQLRCRHDWKLHFQYFCLISKYPSPNVFQPAYGAPSYGAPKPSCTRVPVQNCKNVKSCYKVPKEVCTKSYTVNCKKVPKEQCRTIKVGYSSVLMLFIIMIYHQELRCNPYKVTVPQYQTVRSCSWPPKKHHDQFCTR